MEYEKAIEDYSKVIAIDRDNALAFYDRGLTKNALSEYVSAIDDFDKALSIKKDYYQAYCERGLSHFSLGYYDKALEDYNKSLAIENGYYIAWYNRGLLAHIQGHYEDAIKDYDKVIDIEKNFAPAYNNKGHIYLNTGEYESAIENFSKAIDLNPDLAVAYLNRGIIYNRNFNDDKAYVDFKKALELFKSNPVGNELYKTFLEDSIQLIDEKRTEKKLLDSTKAKPEDKAAKAEIEMRIDQIINRIREAAKSDVKAVVHYTKLSVADIYVKSTDIKMHYSNSIYMNDPTEGSVLFEYLDDMVIKMSYESGEKFSESSVYLGSFLPAEDAKGKTGHEDELVMWRTYGRDEKGNEAAGCSIVIDSAFFKSQNSATSMAAVADDPSNVLLNVIYIKNDPHEKMLQIEPESDINQALKDIKAELNSLIKLKAQDDVDNLFCAEIDKSVYKRLLGISYLFKSADYEYEHEARIIKYVARNSDNIKGMSQNEAGKPSKRLYIESLNYILPYIKKIYLGPKVENHQEWSLYFDFEIRQRNKIVKGMTPAPYTLNPSSVEMLKSTRKFQ
ncbi:MAG: tetratricopeptide repeat protein [Sediminibacterium sp.]